ncbi:hypothetical protein PROPEN_04715 [Proteus penneri ATCC 35198]|nr:hypothetical protein PROPEN_04715 [Proteus penneri ATCC 35198]
MKNQNLSLNLQLQQDNQHQFYYLQKGYRMLKLPLLTSFLVIKSMF